MNYIKEYIQQIENGKLIVGKKVKKEYEKSHFAVLGPEIHLKDGSICKYPKHILKLNEIDNDRKHIKLEIIFI